VIRAAPSPGTPNRWPAITTSALSCPPQGVPDTYGFNGIDASQCIGDTVALTYLSGINGLNTPVRLHWNGNGVEIISNTGG
jgi:hypothetical protein